MPHFRRFKPYTSWICFYVSCSREINFSFSFRHVFVDAIHVKGKDHSIGKLRSKKSTNYCSYTVKETAFDDLHFFVSIRKHLTRVKCCSKLPWFRCFVLMGEGSFISHVNWGLFQNLQREKCVPIFHWSNWLIQCERSGRKLKYFFWLLVFSKYSTFWIRVAQGREL